MEHATTPCETPTTRLVEILLTLGDQKRVSFTKDGQTYYLRRINQAMDSVVFFNISKEGVRGDHYLLINMETHETMMERDTEGNLDFFLNNMEQITSSLSKKPDLLDSKTLNTLLRLENGQVLSFTKEDETYCILRVDQINDKDVTRFSITSDDDPGAYLHFLLVNIKTNEISEYRHGDPNFFSDSIGEIEDSLDAYAFASTYKSPTPLERFGNYCLKYRDRAATTLRGFLGRPQ